MKAMTVLIFEMLMLMVDVDRFGLLGWRDIFRFYTVGFLVVFRLSIVSFFSLERQ